MPRIAGQHLSDQPLGSAKLAAQALARTNAGRFIPW